MCYRAKHGIPWAPLLCTTTAILGWAPTRGPAHLRLAAEPLPSLAASHTAPHPALDERKGELRAAVASTTAAARAPPASWEAQLGQLVTVEGVAEDAKLRALLLIGDSQAIWIDGLDAWPSGVRGKRVQVTGKVIQRGVLPVFVQREGEPVMAGIPCRRGPTWRRRTGGSCWPRRAGRSWSSVRSRQRPSRLMTTI